MKTCTTLTDLKSADVHPLLLQRLADLLGPNWNGDSIIPLAMILDRLGLEDALFALRAAGYTGERVAAQFADFCASYAEEQEFKHSDTFTRALAKDARACAFWCNRPHIGGKAASGYATSAAHMARRSGGDFDRSASTHLRFLLTFWG